MIRQTFATRNTSLTRLAVSMLALMLALIGTMPAAAQDDPQAGFDAELWDAVRERFARGLRTHAQLSDAQLTAILPLVEELEGHRRAARRERAVTGRNLRRAFEDGGSDQQLQQYLDHFEEIDDALRSVEKSTQREIDAELSVRQRVQYRFYANKFRTELQQRVRGLREGRRRPFLDRLRERGNDGG